MWRFADVATPGIVSEAEAGQKLLAYLQRRLGVPAACAHRWIRSGQVRLNGKRCKPFDRVEAGDAVRLPPMAFAQEPPAAPPSSCLPLPPLVASEGGVLLFSKPAGLAVQPGTGHPDSVVARLRAHYADADFVPAPAHRLDRDTTGLLAVGATYAALRRLQDAFAGHVELRKEYLCWVRGQCPWEGTARLEDRLRKEGPSGAEKMRVQRPEPDGSASGLPAALLARCLEERRVQGKPYSLLQVALETGRTHQIRVQLAERGLPLLGDGKYGPVADVPEGLGLYLHAFRLCFDGRDHILAPPWTGPWAVTFEGQGPPETLTAAATLQEMPMKRPETPSGRRCDSAMNERSKEST